MSVDIDMLGVADKNGHKEVETGATKEDEGTFKLRSYQDEMLEESLKRNSIIVLDTGAGKTHIAIARIRAELESCSVDKLVWFLAPTVALCQQHTIALQAHLSDYQLRVLTGDDEVERWTEQVIWDAVLKNIRIVISTPAVLYDALTHAFVTMPRLALCVFDEAHHCKKSHPSKLIMDFYFDAKRKGVSVPHILGLSASPVTNARTGGLELLEANLDSYVITPKLRRLELMQYVHVPELLKYVYPAMSMENLSTQSLLYGASLNALHNYELQKDPYIIDLKSANDSDSAAQLFQAHLKRKTYCLDQLKALNSRVEVILQDIGPNALDWYLRACSQRMTKGLDHANSYWMPGLSEKEKRHLAKILCEIATCNSATMDSTWVLAPKTQILLEILAREVNSSFTGIIFAEQRSVVATLAVLISSHPLTAGLFNVGTFVGGSASPNRKGNIGDIVELNGQQQNLEDFRIGKKNLIIATSVLEEGIDVSSCQTVICFDAPKNLISFVQRRGRARKRGSKYIVLLGEADTKAEPSKWQELEEKMKAAYMDELRNAQLAAEFEEKADYDGRQYPVSSTGALLTTKNAKAHLYHFCSTLLTGGYTRLEPEFICRPDPSTALITAEVILPVAVHSSVRRARSSRPFQTERAAMADASFEAYVALHKNGLVNDNLLPLGRKVSDLENDIPSRPSLMQVLPRLNPWSLEPGESLHWSRSIVELDIGGERMGSLSMLLPMELPEALKIDLHWNASTKGTVRVSKDSNSPNHSDSNMQSCVVEEASRETAILLSAVYSGSRINFDKRDFVAMFQPYGHRVSSDVLPAWDVVFGNNHGISSTDYGLLRVNGQIGRAFALQQLVDNPTESGPLEVWARKFPKKRDFLHRPDEAASLKDTPLVKLPLTECTMDVLPARYTFTAACIPSILHCVEQMMLATELQRTLLKPIAISDLDLIIEATTSSAANNQRNYERLEYLGDSVLKYCTHLQLMAQHPTWPEGYLTNEKGRTNGNASLAKASIKSGVYRFISTQAFTALRWTPPYLSDIPPNGAEEMVERSTKTLADVIESLIGASFLNKGLTGALTCIRIFLPDELWFDLHKAHDMLRDSKPAMKMPNSELLEELIGYRFNNQTLLLEATTNASFQSKEATSSYERLEFLGDAVLDQIVVPELFKHHSSLKNHEMHRLRQSLANAYFLGFLCMELSAEQERVNIIKNTESMAKTRSVFEPTPSSHTFHLYDFLRCDRSVAAQRTAALPKHKRLREEILEALQHGQEYPWATLFELHPPKLFCDMLEALLGAIYVDSHGSLDTCCAFLEHCGFLRLMRRFLDEGVEVGYPKERLGRLADKDRVSYLTKKSDRVGEEEGMFECTVKVGDREILTIRDCTYADEAEVKAASTAVDILLRERASVGTGIGSQETNIDGNEDKMDEE